MKLLNKNKEGNGKSDVTRRPSEPLSTIQREVDRAFDRIRRIVEVAKSPDFGDFLASPAVDISEDEKAVTVRADVPGLDAKDIDVEVSGNALTISGSRREEKKEEKAGYTRHERRAGSFSRTVTLPSYADAGKIDAHYDKGVLTLKVPKIPGQGPRRVAVKTM